MLNFFLIYFFLFIFKTGPRKRSLNPAYCSSKDGGGWKFHKSCYHIVKEMKSWQMAEIHCKENYNGHLVTISDMLVDYFLEHILANIKEEFWIGIKIKVSSTKVFYDIISNLFEYVNWPFNYLLYIYKYNW